MSSYIALYRKWRPNVFEDVIGQEHITDVLRGEIERGSVSHAYLFCGSRGTGKTTCAKILAKAVSCENPHNGDPCGECNNCKKAFGSFDISEIDAASNNGVDNIRELREEVLYPPTELKRRVYIIDEVHMLSQGAFNALLKTLEEPPEHAMFILATTELNKIPATILSRCKRFDFHRITPENIAKRLKFICEKESIKLTDGAIMLISRLAGGAMRDALSMLELFVGKENEITEEECAKTLGIIGKGPVMKLLRAVSENNCSAALEVIADAYCDSKDMGVLLSECADTMRDMLMIKYTKSPEKFIEGSQDIIASLSEFSKKFTKERLLYSTDIIDEAQNKMARTSFSRRAILETCIIKLCDVKLWPLPESLNTRVSELEDKISGVNISFNNHTLEDTVKQTAIKIKNTEIDFDHSEIPPENADDLPPFDIDEGKVSPVQTSDTHENNSDNDMEQNNSNKTISDNKKATANNVSEPLLALPEIIEEISAKDKICSSLMSGAKGVIRDKKAIIFVSSFAYGMLSKDEKKMSIIISCAKRLLGDMDVILTSEEKIEIEEWDL